MAERGARVLIVDDNRVNRLLLSRSVEIQGHQVATAENGRDALTLLSSESFDLMLLDMEMPEMNGFEVMERVRNDPELRAVPVIVTSSLEGLDNVIRSIELGADDFLRKPVNQVLLQARINSSLEKKRLRDQQQELIRRFATSEVADDMERSGFALGGRRLDATVMFCDIRDFTALVETQEPEETIDLLNTYYALMFEAIASQNGVVNQIIGDGLMAIFGAPLYLPDPAFAAAHAAIEMIEMIDLLNTDRVIEAKSPIEVGIGIGSGNMIAGYTGTQSRATYTCIGETVNLAARLEAHTRLTDHTILIDEDTCAAIGARLRTHPVGSVSLKGIADPVLIYGLEADTERRRPTGK